MAEPFVTMNGIGLAIAGGGPEGAIYEIGALRALDEAIEGLDLNGLPAYLGVSAGAFLAANLANHITTAQMVRSIVGEEPGEHPFVPELFFKPAVGQLLKSGSDLPRLLFDAASEYLTQRRGHGIMRSMMRLARAMPVGLFDNTPIRHYLQKIYSKPGRVDDFRQLKAKLFVVATDLDAAEAVVFGKPGYDHVPISVAVQASAALPGLYPPVEIEGRHFVDGVLRRTLHTSTILDEGIKLAICLNPIVPVDTGHAVEKGYMKRGKLVDRGMVAVLSQTFRTMIHSRLKIGMRRYDHLYKDADILLFEPDMDDYRMFFTNIFRFSSRKAVCEHAYRATLLDLSRRREVLGPIFAKHGLRLRTEIIDNPERDLWRGVGMDKECHAHPVTYKLEDALARLETICDRAAAESA